MTFLLTLLGSTWLEMWDHKFKSKSGHAPKVMFMAKNPKTADPEHFRKLGKLSYKKRPVAQRSPEYFRELALKGAAKRKQQPGFRKQMARLNSLRKTGTVACRHCGGPISSGNKTEFCRKCQRRLGLPALRKMTVAGKD